jgi:uncharacterized protein YeaO (DUF488 family)
MIVRTASFKAHRGKPDGICIARWAPHWKGERCIELAPAPDILRRAKLAEKNGLPWHIDYERDYKAQLERLDAGRIIERVRGKTLLCFCADYQSCHRLLVAQWLHHSHGIKVDIA